MLPFINSIEAFNKESIEKRNDVRNLFGHKKKPTQFGGLYGIDFLCEKLTEEKSNFIPCLENDCSFRGPSSMMEFHMKTVHEAGLVSRFDVDAETWIADRRKNYPSLSRPKYQVEVTPGKFDRRKRHKGQNNSLQNKEVIHNVDVASSDPMLSFLNKKPIETNTDLLGLGAIYGSSDEEAENVVQISNVNSDFDGLPTPEQLSEKDLIKRKNRFGFPMLPQMDLQSKRNTLMNPRRKYQDIYNRKVKRPRLADLLLADEIESEKNVILQCIRYICNKRFFDPNLQGIPVTSSGDREQRDEKVKDELEFQDSIENEINNEPHGNTASENESDDDVHTWSDNDELQ